MAKTEKIKTEIIADSKGFEAGVKKASKALNSFEKTNKSIAKNVASLWKSVIVVAVATAAIKIGKAVFKVSKELVILGDKSLSLRNSFNNLAKSVDTDSKKLLASMKTAARGTLSEVQLMTQANQMMLMGLDTSVFDEVMEIARRTAKATGQDINYLTESLAMGLGRQSKMILDNLGIVFQTSDAYEWYAETLGKTSKELTEVEKKLGFQAYAMKIARENVEKLGEDTLTLAEVGSIFTTKWADLKAFIGERLVGAIQKAVDRFGGWEKAMKAVNDYIDTALKPTIESIIGWIEKFLLALAEGDWSGVQKGFEELATSMGSISIDMGDAKSTADGFISSLAIIISTTAKFVKGIRTIFTFFSRMFTELVALSKVVIATFEFLVNSTPENLSKIKKSWNAFIAAGNESNRVLSEMGVTGTSVFDAVTKSATKSTSQINETKESIDRAGSAANQLPLNKVFTYTMMQKGYNSIMNLYHSLPTSKTMTYRMHTVGGSGRGYGGGGGGSWQFGGIIPKTQAIMAHGGEVVLSTTMQRNLVALLRQPRVNYNYTVAGDVMLDSVQSEDMINEIARLVSLKQGEEVM